MPHGLGDDDMKKIIFIALGLFLILTGIFFFMNRQQTIDIYNENKINLNGIKSNVELPASPTMPTNKILFVKHQTGLEKYLFYNINPYYNQDGDIIVEADINVTVFNFLKNAYQNPTQAKCNIIKEYINGTEMQDMNWTEIKVS